MERLRREGPLSISALAERLPMTRQAVTKHLDILEKAGLVGRTMKGRERIHHLLADPLKAMDEWLKPYAAAWDERLERLRILVDGGDDDRPDD